MPSLHLEDAARQWAEVRLVSELWKRAAPRPFEAVEGGWRLELGALPVDRLEYELELVRADGSREWQRMPGAPTVDAPFGPKSVWESPAYQPPAWLQQPAAPGRTDALALEAAGLGGPVRCELWAAPGLEEGAPAPLLVAHDGPEYARFSGLVRYLEVAVATGALPRLRAALLAPRARNEDYSASDAYADALAEELLPALEGRAPATVRVGLGASLGALSLLHAHHRRPGLFGALALQSGSYFQRALDPQEHGFARFDRIDAFVRQLAEDAADGPALRVALSCGSAEENLANNRAMADVLARRGHAVRLHELRDLHTWTCWRDSLAQVLPWVLAP